MRGSLFGLEGLRLVKRGDEDVCGGFMMGRLMMIMVEYELKWNGMGYLSIDL